VTAAVTAAAAAAAAMTTTTSPSRGSAIRRGEGMVLPVRTKLVSKLATSKD
jgi:hypothetical protein